MTDQVTQYRIGEVDFSEIRNRNETRVIESMRSALEERGNPELTIKSLRDAYALALNMLPARYRQSGTIILREPIRESQMREVVDNALNQVMNNPKI